MAGKGDLLPVCAFPVDGTWPTGTAQWEKRNIALEIPVWDAKLCIQCNKCALVCPHAAIRPKVYDAAAARPAPRAPSSRVDYKGAEFKGMKYTHPGGPGGLHRLRPLRRRSARPRTRATPSTRRSTWRPRRRCATPEARELRLLPGPARPRPRPQLKLDVKGTPVPAARSSSSPAPAPAAARRPTSSCSPSSSATALLIANATGCSSIYGGNLPTTPYTNERRRPRPGLVQLAVRGQRRVRPRHPPGPRQARPSTPANCSRKLAGQLGDDLVDEHARRRPDHAKPASPPSASGSSTLQEKLAGIDTPEAKRLDAAGRLPGEEDRLDRRRRRLGLRHRLRRPRPRPGLRPQRQHPGARHRGLLQHRRPGLQVHPARRRRPSSPPPARPCPRRTWA